MSSKRPQRKCSELGRPAYLDVALPAGVLPHHGEGGAYSFVADPAISADERRRSSTEQAEEARVRADGLLADLVDQLSAGDPLAFYLQLAVWEAISRVTIAANVAFGYDAAVEFLGGLVTSLPADDVISNVGRDNSPDQMIRVDQLLREYCSAENAAAVAVDSSSDRGEGVRALLRLERRHDRMSGYEQHLRRIVAPMFRAVDQQTANKLGFPVSITDRLVQAMQDIRSSQWEETTEALDFAAERLEGLSRSEKAIVLHAAAAKFGAAKITASLADDLTAASRVQLEQVTAAVEALTTMIGSQTIRTLAEPNRLAEFPIIGLPDGRRVWPSPVDFWQQAIGWLDQLLIDRGEDGLRKSFHRARDEATEALTAEVLADVFGKDSVHRSLEYQLPDGLWAETDVVVLRPGTALVVEAKAHAMTDPGRAGRSDRVERHLKDLLHKPLQQSQRTKDALLRGTQWRHKNGRRFEMPQISEVTRVVLTLEVVDPFVTQAHLVADPDLPDAWIVSLANLMMVADILPHSTELYSYAATRAEVIASGSPIVFMESDALAAWIRNREGVWGELDGAILQLAYQSDELNAYFTAEAINVKGGGASQVAKPDAGIPDYVLSAIDRASAAEVAVWGRLSAAVTSIKPYEWRRLDRRMSAASSTQVNRRSRKRANHAAGGVELSDQVTVQLDAEPGVAQKPEGVGYIIHVRPPV